MVAYNHTFNSARCTAPYLESPLLIHEGYQLPANLKPHAVTVVVGQCAFIRYSGASGGKRDHDAGHVPGIGHRGRVNRPNSREILARNLASHDPDELFGGKFHRGCDVPPSPCKPIHAHQAMLHGFLTRTLRGVVGSDCPRSGIHHGLQRKDNS